MSQGLRVLAEACVDQRQIERVHMTSFASDGLEAAENRARIIRGPRCAEDGACIATPADIGLDQADGVAGFVVAGYLLGMRTRGRPRKTWALVRPTGVERADANEIRIPIE